MKKATIFAAVVLGATVSAALGHAQAGTPVPASLLTNAARVPFGVGERAQYRVSYGMLGRVGTGSMEVAGVELVNGHPSYHLDFRLQGRVALVGRVNNQQESWLDVEGVFSRRFRQDIHELNFKRKRERNFFPEQRRWTGYTNEHQESGELPTSQPLDDTAFLYYVRTLPLEVGREYTLDQYWNPEGNPVVIRVLRTERVRVPAGTFDAIVVQPIIKTGGLFSEGGRAEVYFTNDAQRILLRLHARVSIGTLDLQLEEYTPGRPLNAAAGTRL
jgi:hypothetical protein